MSPEGAARRSHATLLESGSGGPAPCSGLHRPGEVFAPLVRALVFKTSGGFEQSSQWVRFPYTSVSLFHKDLGQLDYPRSSRGGQIQKAAAQPSAVATLLAAETLRSTAIADQPAVAAKR